MSNRSVVEIMTLAFTAVVCFAILAVGAFIAIQEIRDPSIDTHEITTNLMSAISGMLGALLGLVAGRASMHPPDTKTQTDALYRRPAPPDDPEE